MALIHYAGQGNGAISALKSLKPLMPQRGVDGASVNQLLHIAQTQASQATRESRRAIAAMEPDHQLVLSQLERGYYYELEDALPALENLATAISDGTVSLLEQANYIIMTGQLGLPDADLESHAQSLVQFLDADIPSTSALLMVRVADDIEDRLESTTIMDTLSLSLAHKVMSLRHIIKQADYTGKLELDLKTVVPILGVIAAIKTSENGEYIGRNGNIVDQSAPSTLWRAVDEFELSVRTANCLQNAHIKYIGQLVLRSEEDMLKTKNFGRKALREIKELLADFDLALDMKFDGWIKDGPPPPRPSI